MNMLAILMMTTSTVQGQQMPAPSKDEMLHKLQELVESAINLPIKIKPTGNSVTVKLAPGVNTGVTSDEDLIPLETSDLPGQSTGLPDLSGDGLSIGSGTFDEFLPEDPIPETPAADSTEDEPQAPSERPTCEFEGRTVQHGGKITTDTAICRCHAPMISCVSRCTPAVKACPGGETLSYTSCEPEPKCPRVAVRECFPMAVRCLDGTLLEHTSCERAPRCPPRARCVPMAKECAMGVMRWTSCEPEPECSLLTRDDRPCEFDGKLYASGAFFANGLCTCMDGLVACQ